MTPYDRARLNLLSAYKAVAAFASNRYAVKALSSAAYGKELAAIGNKATDEQKTRDRIAALILLYAFWAWEDGVKESGADPATPAAQSQGQQATTTFVAQQTQYAAGLATAMIQNNATQAWPIGLPVPPDIGTGFVTAEMKQASAADVESRIGMWVESLNAQRLQGMADGAKLSDGKEIIGHWVLGETDVHCLSERGMTGCLELSQMKPMPLSEFVSNGWIPRAPGNEEITCGGYRCKCKILDENGRQLM